MPYSGFMETWKERIKELDALDKNRAHVVRQLCKAARPHLTEGTCVQTRVGGAVYTGTVYRQPARGSLVVLVTWAREAGRANPSPRWPIKNIELV